MRVLILRGLPGSGKSTWAEQEGGSICSADKYHVRDGVYRFDPKLAGDAHSRCLRLFISLIHSVMQVIIVDNTNITVAEIAPYYRLAEALGATPEIVEFPCTVQESVSRNIHSVPVETILKMARDLAIADIPPYWRRSLATTASTPQS